MGVKVKYFDVEEPDFSSAFDELGSVMVNEMKALIPVRTGLTKDSLTHEVTKRGFRIFANSKRYKLLHLIERGTKHSAAHPFMKPVVRLHSKEVEEAIYEVINKAVKLK